MLKKIHSRATPMQDVKMNWQAWTPKLLNHLNLSLSLSLCFTLCIISCRPIHKTQIDVLVIGGGTSGVSAGISAARLGANTLVVEAGPWLGGMISAAGVTCTDGNHNLPSGIWGEFREKLYNHYGGPAAVATGWVSHTQFEPHVSDSIWKAMASAESRLKVQHGWQFSSTKKEGNRITGAIFMDEKGRHHEVQAKITIDATEMGDAFANAGISYDLGMEAGESAGENVGVDSSYPIVQDLTWVATLKDYGPAADCTIAKPSGYTPEEFDGACTDFYKDSSKKAPTVNGKKMLDYGKLPHGKYMINWPNAGNDTYLNVVELSSADREQELQKAKATTLRFVYFIQHQLGFKNLGLADDEFPTADRLALMPYYREGRRMHGMVRMNIRHIAEPFTYDSNLFRTGVVVGDYPIDHHHKKNIAAPQHLDFYPVPSYSIPLGTMLPREHEGIIIAEKGISVSNVVNGTTRLQPVSILIGQVAGTLAALSIKSGAAPKQIPVRDVQQSLLDQQAMLMPYMDVAVGDTDFAAIQRIGATGILRGTGIPFNWANQTWFYPDAPVQLDSLLQNLQPYVKISYSHKQQYLTIKSALQLIFQLLPHFQRQYASTMDAFVQQQVITESQWVMPVDEMEKRLITRRQMAQLLDKYVDPFAIPVNHQGAIQWPVLP